MAERVIHPLTPWWDPCARVLLLGSLPSPASRARAMYYGHPQNRFWQTLASLFDEPTPSGPLEAQNFCRQHRIALWDVVASCEIKGAADASIKNVSVNDLQSIISAAQIKAIFCTGKKAHSLYQEFIEPTLGRPAHYLPSTSAANRGRFSDGALVEAYSVLLPYLRADEPLPFQTGQQLFTYSSDSGEESTILYEDEAIRIERIVSHNHSSPTQGYYDQAEAEWVSVINGSACLQNEHGHCHHLKSGDTLFIPPHQRHRVAATSDPCIWLCVYRKVET